ncbi:MAG: hypothetical protein J6S59_06400 [Clostridia bacterium]|nr:hypothetical protein [Clostridia bacterium]
MARKLSGSEKTAVVLTVFVVLLMALVLMVGRSLIAGGNHITTTVVEYDTVRNTAVAEGLIIRQEKALSASGGQYGLLLAEDGEKVAQGDEVALRFSAESQLAAHREAQRLKAEIELLREAKATAGRDSDLTGVNERLYESMLGLSAAADSGSAGDIYADRALETIVLRNCILNENYDISARIAALEDKYDRLVRAAGGGSYVRAPSAGYYSAASDGYVGRLLYSKAEELDTAELLELRKSVGAASSDTAGTLIFGYEWYYAAILAEEDVKALREGRTYALSFADFEVNGTLTRMGTPAEGKVLCLFYINTRLERAVSLREVSAEIVFDTVSGYRIPKASLRISAEGKRGVYVIRGQRCVFMEVDIMLEKDNYYVVRADLADNTGLYLYDTLVLSGKDLYDGMVINN